VTRKKRGRFYRQCLVAAICLLPPFTRRFRLGFALLRRGSRITHHRAGVLALEGCRVHLCIPSSRPLTYRPRGSGILTGLSFLSDTSPWSTRSIVRLDAEQTGLLHHRPFEPQRPGKEAGGVHLFREPYKEAAAARRYPLVPKSVMSLLYQGSIARCSLLQDLVQSCSRGGRGEWRTCAGSLEICNNSEATQESRLLLEGDRILRKTRRHGHGNRGRCWV
jgi:hypothetical protein